MIYTDTASEVAQNVAKDLTVPPPQPPVAASEPMGRYAEDQFSAPAPSAPAYIPSPAYIPQPQVMGRYGEDQYAPQPPTPMPQGVAPSSLAQLQQMAGIGPAFLARITNALPAIDLYNSISNANPGATPDQIKRVIQYAQNSNNPQGNIQGFLNPKEDIGYEQFANMTNAPFAAAQKAVESVPVTPYGTSLGSEINRLPAPLATAGHLATGAVLPVAADIATGGALTPAYLGQAAIQASAIGDQYKAGKLSGDDALKALAMTAGPFVLPILLRAATAGGRALLDYAQSDQGQAFLNRINNEQRGSVGNPPPGEGGRPPEPPQEPPAEARAGEAGAPAPAQPPPSPEQARLASTQGALEGMQPENTGAPTAREQGVSKQSQTVENISRSPQEITQDATAQGATPSVAESGRQALTQIDAIPNGEPLLGKSKLTQAVAARAAQVTGSLPGVAGKIRDITMRLGNALSYDANHTIRPLANKVLDAINNDLQHGATFIGKDASKMDAATSPQSYVFEFPNDFQGLSPQTVSLIDQLKQAQQGHFAMLRAIDPTTAQPVGSYLMHMYKSDTGEPSPLETYIPRQRGETRVAQSRQFKDWRVAVDQGKEMVKMPFVDHVMTGIFQTDRGIQDAMFRKGLLEKVGSTEKAPGMVAVTNPIFTRPEEGPWYVPKAINDQINAAFAPPPALVRSTARVSRALKGVLVFPFDIAGAALRIREVGTVNPVSIGIGLIHHLFTNPDAFQQNLQYARDGLKQDLAGSIAAESSRIPLGKLAVPYNALTHTPWQVVATLRNLGHEGNLALFKALGKDVSTDTAEGIANRQASANFMNAFSGASLGAQREGRQALEQWATLSQQNTRALFSQLGAASNLLRPGANSAQRLLAAQGIASLATSIWGIGSMINMQYGNGQPLGFPVTYDPQTKQFKYNSGWDMIKIGGTSTPMLAQSSLVNAIAKAFTAVADVRNVKQVPNQLGEAAGALTQFGVGRLGPMTAPIPAAAGIGWTPQGKFSTKLTAGQRLAAALPEPIGVSKFIENPSVLTHPGALAAEQLAGTFPPSPNEPFFAARDLMNQTNFPSADLTSAQQKTLSGLGVSGSNLTEMRAAFADKWTQYYTTHDVHGQPLANPVSPLEAKRVAVSKFDSYSGVKSVRQDQQKAEHQWAHDNPYALLQAVEAGNITPDAYEKTVVEWARAHPKQGQ